MLSRKQLYDYTDIDRGELKLIRIGHALWTILRRERRCLGGTVREQSALEEAIQIIVRLKKEKRAELKVLRAARGEAVRERFAKLRAAS